VISCGGRKIKNQNCGKEEICAGFSTEPLSLILKPQRHKDTKK
jgi:hypothetical protein